MKKKIIPILFVSFVAMVFNACKKEVPDQPISFEDEMTVHSKNVLSLIKGFENKMESNLKTGELLEMDSAVWYTEALQNYEYAHPDSGSREFVVFETQYTLPVSPGGMVLMDDVEALYSQMETQLLAELAGISDPVRFLAVTDVALDSVVGNTANLTVSNGIGYGFNTGYLPFDESDDWIWGTLGEEDLGTPPAGLCDPEADYVASDGSNQLRGRLNNPFPGPQQDIMGYTDIEIREATGSEYWDVDEDKGRLFWADVPINHCLYNEDLTYHLWESDDIIYSYEGQGGERPDGKDYIRVEIIDEIITGEGSSTYFHWYKIRYGIPYYDPGIE